MSEHESDIMEEVNNIIRRKEIKEIKENPERILKKRYPELSKKIPGNVDDYSEEDEKNKEDLDQNDSNRWKNYDWDRGGGRDKKD